MRPNPAIGGTGWTPLVLAAITVSTVLATVVAYLIETLPSADGPHPLIFGRLVVDWIAFTVMITLLYGVAIYATRYWDPRATYWEALICLTSLFIAGAVGRAIAELAGVTDANLRKAAFFIPAIGGYLFARCVYRRRRTAATTPRGSVRKN